jgi:hypothetical protein
MILAMISIVAITLPFWGDGGSIKNFEIYQCCKFQDFSMTKLNSSNLV